MIPRTVVLAGLAAGVIVATAAPAFAHVEVDPSRVKPGKAATVEFSPEHGCGKDAPTTRMTFRVPRGVTDAEGIAPEGWQASTSGRRIVFEGGPLPYHEQAAFGISFTAPDSKTLLTWKVIQSCDDETVRWIETDHDAESPAPVVGVGRSPSSDDEDDH